MATVPQGVISTMGMPVPPREEQQVIAEALDIEMNKVRVAVTTNLQEIELIREYRTRLIADVVTGKLDVREAEAKLPDEDGGADLGDVEDAEPTEAMEEPTEAEGAPDADE